MPETEEKKAKSFFTPKTIIGLVVVALAVVVIVQNTEAVETRLLFWTITMPRVVLLGLMLAVGFVAGFFGRRRKK